MAPHATLFDINLPAQGIIRPRRIDLSAFSSDTEPGSVCAYLGIPFAQPPVGALRWRVPQGPAPSWQGIRESRWAQVPPQSRALMAGVFSLRKGENEEHDPIGQSEDCLYTNVWVPQRRDGEGRNEKWPVMVWIYGGAFVSGSCSSPAFDGARLAHESRAIVVSVTYRIGVMGFLGSRILASESAGPHPLVPVHAPSSVDRVSGTGNYGLWDAVAGLLWIRSNIEHFGGDANAVTAFGESAGSILLHYLLLSPAVPSGLFARAILQSGSVETVLPRSLASAQATFDELARFVAPGVTDSQARLEALRAASPAELIEISSRLPMRRPRTEYTPNESENRPTDRRSIPAESLQLEPIGVWGPVWDGVFVPRDLRSLVRAGLPPASTLRNAREGILLGYNVDEGTMFNVPIASSAALKQHVSAFHPSLSPQIARLYATDSATDDPSAFAVCAAYSGDILFESPIRALMSTLARVGDEDLSPREKKSPPAWGYVFAHRPTLRLLRGISASPGQVHTLGAMHGADIPFVFGYDGTEMHTQTALAGEYGVDPGTPARVASRSGSSSSSSSNSVSSLDSGFTPAERTLSLYMMRTWASFAQGQDLPWSTLSSYKNVNAAAPASTLTSDATHLIPALPVLAIGDVPRLGSQSTLARKSVQNDLEATKAGQIEILEKVIGDLNSWKERVGPERSASAAEKQDFWMGDNGKRLWLCYYGDPEMAWAP